MPWEDVPKVIRYVNFGKIWQQIFAPVIEDKNRIDTNDEDDDEEEDEEDLDDNSNNRRVVYVKDEFWFPLSTNGGDLRSRTFCWFTDFSDFIFSAVLYNLYLPLPFIPRSLFCQHFLTMENPLFSFEVSFSIFFEKFSPVGGNRGGGLRNLLMDFEIQIEKCSVLKFLDIFYF